jgi:hypothetical protein
MEISVLTLPARFYILKKRYTAFCRCIFVQNKSHINHDKLDDIYLFSGSTGWKNYSLSKG